MSTNSLIQWCDDTVNPVMGCNGCELWRKNGAPAEQRCYAGALTQSKRGNNRVHAADFDTPELFPGRMAGAARRGALLGKRRNRDPRKPWLDGARRLVFVSDMADALSEGPYRDGGDYETADDQTRAKRGSLHTGGIPDDYLKREIIDIVQSVYRTRFLGHGIDLRRTA